MLPVLSLWRILTTGWGRFSSNAVIKEHDVGEQIASAGPGLMWKIHKGTFRSQRKPVAVWIFDKKGLLADKTLDKRQKDKLIDVLRRGPLELVKLKHPSVLAITHPLAESKESLAFATEPIFSSLANVLGKTDNVDKVPLSVREFQLLEIEILMGLIQLSAACTFLHQAELIHGNITPNNIVLNQNGEWRLCGFEFSLHTKYQGADESSRFEYPETNITNAIDRACLPDLNYRAPEYYISGIGEVRSDIYSIAHVIYACHNGGAPIADCQGNLLAYQANLETISRTASTAFSSLPLALQELVKLMLNTHPSVRPTAEDFSRAPCFDNLQIQCLRYLATIYEKTDPNKAKFMKGLPQVLPDFPHRVTLKKILPPLLEELKNSVMMPFALVPVMIIAEACSVVEFETLIFEHLVPIFEVTEPVQVMSIFMHKFELLLSKAPKTKVNTHIYPILERSLASSVPQMQLLAFQLLPGFQNALDFAIVKATILPLVQAACLNTDRPDVRIQSLVCIGQLLPSFDKWLMKESVLPFLLKLPSREPGVVMAFFGVLKMAISDAKYGVTADMIAGHLLPFAVPMSVLPSLNSEQVTTVLAICRNMLKAVHDERIEALKETESMRESAKETVGIATGSSTSVDVGNVFEQSGTSPVFDIGAASRAAAKADQEAERQKEAAALAAASRVAESFVAPTAPSHGASGGDVDLFGGSQFTAKPRGGGEEAASLFGGGALSGGSSSTRSPRTQRTSRAYKGLQTTDSAAIGSSVGALGSLPGQQSGGSVFGAPQQTTPQQTGGGSVFGASQSGGSVFGASQMTGGSVFGVGLPGESSVFGGTQGAGSVMAGGAPSMGSHSSGMGVSGFGGQQTFGGMSTGNRGAGFGSSTTPAQGGGSVFGDPPATQGSVFSSGSAGPASSSIGGNPWGVQSGFGVSGTQPQQNKPPPSQGNLLDLGFPSPGPNSGSLI